MENEWKYYNHAIIPKKAPHQEVTEPNHKIWKNIQGGGKPLFARWTEEFDCGYETLWWYVIKDTPFDINSIKSKRRYEIKKGLKNFEVNIINADEYAEELYQVTLKAYEGYPEKYRPNISRESFEKGLTNWKNHEVYAAFYKESGKMRGYAWIDVYSEYIDFCVLKAHPEYERYGINAALVYAIVNQYNDKLGKNFYICDGARSTLHETKFQDYLEKYFEFRKAYCKLRLKYRFPVGAIVKIIYPFRKVISNESSLGTKVRTLLEFEKIVREE